MSRVIATGVVLTLALVACGSDDDGDTITTDPLTTSAPATDAPPATDPPATDPPTTDPPATDPPATDPPATDAPADAASFAEAAGLGTVELAAAGGEPHPLLAWAPVDGAAAYRVTVLTSDGSPYWAWLGENTEVRFGGAPDGGGQTAILFEPMTWTVVALDADGLPIAASDRADITP